MSKYSVMIIEDDPMFSELLRDILKDHPKYEITDVIGDSVNFVVSLEKLKPDVLILDINISGLDGPEIIELSSHKPKIVMVSSHPESKMIEYHIQYEAYIQKPLQSPDQLLSALDKALSS